jgi:uncharacterized damage-inducible protein DinB
MAGYNAWMNTKVLDAAMTLPDEALVADRQAFFGSILGTLNHLAVADTLWLKRFATHPANYLELANILDLPTPASLDQTLFSDIRSFAAYRKMLDDMIVKWVATVTDADLEHVLHYASTKGVVSDKRFFSLLMHFFNHQTHHRGQISTMLFQAGVDVGITDLVTMIPSVEY